MDPSFRADDRVLLLAIPQAETLAALARCLLQGVVVAIGTRNEVDRGRRELADFDNVMLVESSPSSIPWRDAYFTKIVVPPQYELLMSTAAAEWRRLLAEGGAIVRQTLDA